MSRTAASTSPKKPVDITYIGGINNLHTRQVNEPSTGKNFRSYNGDLTTRGGSVEIAGTSFASPIRSIHAAPKVGYDTRLIVEEGTNLWHRTTDGGGWTLLKSDVSGTHGFRSCLWSNYLILVNGEQALAYDIENATIADLEDSPPHMQHVINGNDLIYGWAPDYEDSDRINYCAEDSDGNPSKDLWDTSERYFTAGDSSSPVLDVIILDTHKFILTKKNCLKLYSEPGSFQPSYAGAIGAYKSKLSAIVRDVVFWVGMDNGIKKIFAYSGTSPYEVGQKISTFLQEESFDYAWACSVGNQYKLFLPNTTTGVTRIYTFDLGVMDDADNDSKWYIDEFPWLFMCGCSYCVNYIDQEYLYLGTNDNKIVKLDESLTNDNGTAITSDVTFGPLRAEGRKNKIKDLFIGALPENDFDVDVYIGVDDKEEKGPYTASFEEGNQADLRLILHGFKGRNITIRLTSTDTVSKIQQLTPYIVPGAVI